MPVLHSAGPSGGIRQPAVWIVTDDATYEDLGVLVSAPMGMPAGYGGSRVIRELHAAIDIARKAIWRDRGRILSALNDADLKARMESLDERS